MTQREDTAGKTRRGTVVTFYSFKGGTGRTMALANVAWILASAGRRVLTMDWDLEAPGLHRYFFPLLGDPGLDSTPGLIDLVRDFDQLAVKPQSYTELRELARVDRYASSLRHEFPAGGYIDYVSPGRQTPEYSRTVNTYDWRGFYEARGGSQFLDALRDDMRERYDYALIDSRTGFSDTSGITTVQLPDVLVNCFTFNTQAINGAAAIAKDVRRQASQVRILPVPMRAEDAEQRKLEISRDFARSQFRDIMPELSDAEVERYWGDVEVPYRTFYAYEETLATINDRSHQAGSLLSAYERLTSLITGGDVTALRQLPEDQRDRLQKRFERDRPAASKQVTSVRIDFAVHDQMWAEWIKAQLEAEGVAVHLQASSPSPAFAATTGAGQPDAADTVIALLSPSFRSTSGFENLLKLITDGDRRVLAVRPGEYVPDRDLNLRNVTFAGYDAEAAREQLYALLNLGTPTGPVVETVRYPASRQKANNTRHRNNAFTGRDDVLERVRTALGAEALQPEGPVGTANLYGISGMGKTQIALEYSHRFGAQYDVIWWVSSDELTGVPAAVAGLGERLGIPGATVAERVQNTLEQLHSGAHGRFLLVYDNVTETDLDLVEGAGPLHLRDHLPSRGPGHVLVTSRQSDALALRHNFHVETFAREESIALLKRRAPSLTREDASRVADALGDLPMAVSLAGAWFRAAAISVDDYLDELAAQVSAALSTVEVPERSSLIAAWLLSFEGLQARFPAAARVLEVCAFMAPEPVAATLLYNSAMWEYAAEADPNVSGNRMIFARQIAALGSYAMARTDQGNSSIQVHRLLQAAVRERLATDPERFEQTRRQAHRVLATAHTALITNFDENSPDARRRYAELAPHLLPSGAADSPDEAVRRWIIAQVRNAWLINDHIGAVALGSRVHDAWVHRFGDDPLTLKIAAQLANPLRSLAEYERALELDQSTLRRQRAHDLLGPDHEDTLVSARNTAADLRGLGRYQEAYELDRETYERCVAVFGENDPATLFAGNNLGLSLNAIGRPREGLRQHRDTYQRRRQYNGLLSPLTWGTATNLAQGMRDNGEYAASQQLLLETRRQLIPLEGENSPMVLRVDRSLAVTLRRLGEYDQALALSDTTHMAYRQRFGADHPDTLASLTNLACDLYYSNGGAEASAEARRRGEQAYRSYQESLGAAHPFTLAAAANLSLFLRANQEPSAALELSTRALGELELALSAHHPATVVCRSGRAGALAALGRHEEALEEDVRVLQGFRQIFGDEHPRSLAAEYNVALQQGLAGAPGAEQALEGALAHLHALLAPTSPTLRDAEEGHRVDFDLEMPP
ncbi:tetratricopeptide (TPR) repeat protein [Streptacidiphilus sp. MAP12-33]|uniref:FxSxx-COOH system tetratricopeptide repeat protein n=1 Tax=Streptacidiphilus sp. MAP12-33 TaxID=3156266 RepID=UPI0035132437